MFVVETENNSMPNIDHVSSELEKLLSPEKALQLLCALVQRNPVLWGQLDAILHPNQDIDTAEINKFTEAAHITNVLANLRQLQLSKLPLDTLGTIAKFLSIKSCLDLSETSQFFNKIIPKYIDMINLEQEVCESIYKLFSKCERVRHLSIDGTHKQQIGSCHGNKLLFSFPFTKFKTVREMVLSNIKFVENKDEIYTFDGGKYSLTDLQLNFVSNIDAQTWLTFTSSEHCPNLENLTIQSSTNITANDSMNKFTAKLVSSQCHSQIRNLTLATSNISDLESLRMNKSLITNLRRLEIGLIDRQCRNFDTEFADNYTDISKMFRTLFCADSAKKNENYHTFPNLEMLLIDFCPKAFSQGYNDISPSDLSDFIQSIPTVFPNLKLLALYGSASELLFNDTHLNALLLKTSNVSLPNIIDLSIGFEDLSFPCNDFITDILDTFPNLAWLTLENEQYLMDPKRFQNTVKESFQKYTDEHENELNLQWITLCAARKDEIHEISKGVYVEYWERGIQACDFDAALVRSQQIINKKKKENAAKERQLNKQLSIGSI